MHHLRLITYKTVWQAILMYLVNEPLSLKCVFLQFNMYVFTAKKWGSPQVQPVSQLGISSLSDLTNISQCWLTKANIAKYYVSLPEECCRDNKLLMSPGMGYSLPAAPPLVSQNPPLFSQADHGLPYPRCTPLHLWTPGNKSWLHSF